VKIAIGVRKAPGPKGRAGFVHIDTVHQGDLDDGIRVGIHRIKRIRQKLGLRCKQKRGCKNYCVNGQSAGNCSPEFDS
jgi:hypothetical protein